MKTVNDVIEYLEKDIEVTEECMKVGKMGDLFKNFEVRDVTETDKKNAEIITNYISKILIPVLKGELKYKHYTDEPEQLFK